MHSHSKQGHTADHGTHKPLPKLHLCATPLLDLAHTNLISAGSSSGSTSLYRTTSFSAADYQAHLARYHPAVTVMFADIVSFTNMCSDSSPATIMAFLNTFFSAFDKLVEVHGVYKVGVGGVQYNGKGR